MHYFWNYNSPTCNVGFARWVCTCVFVCVCLLRDGARLYVRDAAAIYTACLAGGFRFVMRCSAELRCYALGVVFWVFIGHAGVRWELAEVEVIECLNNPKECACVPHDLRPSIWKAISVERAFIRFAFSATNCRRVPWQMCWVLCFITYILSYCNYYIETNFISLFGGSTYYSRVKRNRSAFPRISDNIFVRVNWWDTPNCIWVFELKLS